MIRINLIRGKRKKRRELNLNFLYLLFPVVVLAGILLFHMMIKNRIETLQSNIQKATVEIARLKKEIGEVEKFKARKADGADSDSVRIVNVARPRAVRGAGKFERARFRPFGRIEPAFAQFVQLLRGGSNRGAKFGGCGSATFRSLHRG